MGRSQLIGPLRAYRVRVRVLLVEDDDRVARGLTRALVRAGYRVVRATGVEQARVALGRELPELALVDMGLPDGDGGDVVRLLREHDAIGVLVVTARGEEHDRVRGLRAGADDYVVKPFSLAELLARVDAVSRRTRALRQLATDAPTMHRLGGLELDTGARLVRDADGTQVPLTGTECEVLALLITRAGTVVAREVFLDQVWGTPSEPGSRSLDTHVRALRSKLGGRLPIRTVRGVGYGVATDPPVDP